MVNRPFCPFEHAVMASEFEPSSYVLSYETDTEDDVVAPNTAGRTAERRARAEHTADRIVVGERWSVERMGGAGTTSQKCLAAFTCAR